MRVFQKIFALFALFLCVTMFFSPASNAAFKDEDSILADLSSDIELMTALGVFQGDENGNFNPSGTVTRAQAAKMIYVLKNGGIDDGASAFIGVSPYTDVTSGFWAEGYINYCTTSGYMSGWSSNGQQVFAPNSDITAVEFAKLLLCMVGYRSDIQGYTGSEWQSNVIYDASQSGIFFNFSPSVYEKVQRQWAARLLVNAVNSKTVVYTRGEVVYGPSSYAEKQLKVFSVTGELVETKGTRLVTSGSPAKGKITEGSRCKILVSKAQPGDPAGTYELDYTLDEDLLGQEIRVYYRAGTVPGVENASKIFSVVPYNDQYHAYSVVLDQTTVDGTNVSFDDFHCNQKHPITVVDNYVEQGRTVSIQSEDDWSSLGFGTKDNRTVHILVQDNQIVKVFYTSPTYAIVRDIDTSRYRFDLENGAKAPARIYLHTDGTIGRQSTDRLVFGNTESGRDAYEQLEFLDTVQAGDVVAITPTYHTGQLVFEIRKAPVISGTVSSFQIDSKTKTYSSLTINGISYGVSNLKLDGYHFSYETKDNLDGVIAKEATTFYTDGKYIIFANGGKASSSISKDLAYVIALDQGNDTFAYERPAVVKLLFPDNTIKTLNYANTDNLPADALQLDTEKAEVAVGVVYEYVLEDSNTVYLCPVSASGPDAVAGTATESITYDSNSESFNVNGVEVFTDENSVVFIKYGLRSEDPKYAAVKASEIKYNINVYEDDKTTNGNKNGKQFGYAFQQGFPTLAFAVVNFENKEYLPSGKADKQFAVVTGDAVISGEDGSRFIVSLPVAGTNGLNTLQFRLAKASVEKNLSDLNEFRDHLVSYELDGEYALIGSIKTVSAAGYGDDAWAKVAISGSNESMIFGLDVLNDQQGIYYKISEDTSVIYVESDKDGHISPSTDDSIAASEDMEVPNALVYGRSVSNGGLLEASVIVVETYGASLDHLA